MGIRPKIHIAPKTGIRSKIHIGPKIYMDQNLYKILNRNCKGFYPRVRNPNEDFKKILNWKNGTAYTKSTLPTLFALLYYLILYFIILLYILVELRKTMMENSRMRNFIFSDRDNDRNVKHDSLKNFRGHKFCKYLHLYIPIVI